MPVPLLDLEAQYRPLRSAILDAVTAVCDSQRYILGPETVALEQELAAVLGAADAIGVSSGTDALLAALMAVGVGPGDEVITPAYSFFATAGCVARLGATPVFVDIDRATFNLAVDQVAERVTPRTRAIIPVHLFGQCADMEPLLPLSASTGIPLIEDACQSIGAAYAGRQAGTMGAFGCFSFFPSKNLGAFGDGGLVTAADADRARKIRLLRSHGAATKYFHDEVGGNFRLDEIQAAILRVKLRALDDWTRARQRNAARYRGLFEALGVDEVVLPEEVPGRTHIYNQFVIRVPRRDAVKAHLQSAGIGCEVYYPRPFHLQQCFSHLGHQPGAFPESESAASESLAIPIFAELTEGQQAEVVSVVGAALGR